VDARKGVLPQSRRHAYIASLLGIPHILVAVNKMDLVEFRAEVFQDIEQQFREFAAPLRLKDPHFVPISALDGDNVVTRSQRTPWYHGPSLLELLETVPVAAEQEFDELRFPVQYVIRPTLDFRGYAGQISSGEIKPGQSVMVVPSGRTSRVKAISTFDGNLEEAYAPMSVTVTLEDELDISRGDMLVSPRHMPHVSRRFDAMVVWMNAEPMDTEKGYLLKHTTQQVRANISKIHHKVDVQNLGRLDADRLELNEIGSVSIETHRPLFFDDYAHSRATGGFILIDPLTNATLAAGMISGRSGSESLSKSALLGVEFETSRVTPAERFTRSGHHPATVWMTARKDVVHLVERQLFDRGCLVHVLADEVDSHLLPELAKISNAAGLITLCSSASSEPEDRERARALIGTAGFVDVDPQELSPDDNIAADQICQILENRGFIRKHERFAGGEGI
jgi:sulfate adenylyltransferase large subunit